jgi:hypothetical protein
MPEVPDGLHLGGTDLREVEDFAVRLLAFYRLDGWTFGWDNARRRLGLCDHRRRRVSVSKFFLASGPTPASIEDTVRHETAHAIVGSGHGHDAVWKAKCREIGARPIRCGTADMPRGRWRAACPACRRAFHRHRLKAGRRMWCRACGPERGLLTWRLDGGQATMPRIATGNAGEDRAP